MEHVFARVLGVELERPFPRLRYEEALARFGTDKPDLRFGLELRELTDLVQATEFRIFSQTIAAGGAVVGLNLPGGARYSRRELDQLEELARGLGAKGLLWVKFREDGLEGPLAKFLPGETAAALRERLEASPGDLALLVADEPATAREALGGLRVELARREGLIPEAKADSEWRFLWIVDPPLLEWSEEEGRLVSVHHPFTMPREEDLELLDHQPEAVRAQAYDLVLNGVEVAGGSIRIHRRDLQSRIFRVLGISEEEAEEKFGFFLRALEYGAPPHGGSLSGSTAW